MKGPTQGGKSQVFIICVSWLIQNDPSTVIWIGANERNLKTFVQQRWWPTVERNIWLRDLMPKGRTERTTMQIQFPSGPLLFGSAESPGDLSSTTARRTVYDELRLWPPGAFEMLQKRMVSKMNSMALIGSTPGDEGDCVDQAFQDGDQRRYFVPCPVCGAKQELDWKRMKWDSNEITQPGKQYDWDALARTIRYECVACNGPIMDDPLIRRRMVESGEWRPMNPRVRDKHSYTWSALIIWWMPWRSLVQEFLTATGWAKMGVIEPLRTFVCETLAESWKQDHDATIIEPVKEIRVENAEWKEEKLRVLTVDVQADCFKCLIRAWSENASRLSSYQTVFTWDDVRKLQLDSKIGNRAKDPKGHWLNSGAWILNDSMVFVDAGDGSRTFDVYNESARFGWTALKGEDRPSYAHTLKVSNRIVQRPYSAIKFADPARGRAMILRGYKMRQARWFSWSNPWIKGLTDSLRKGKITGYTWSVPDGIGMDYIKELNGEVLRQIRNKADNKTRWRWVQIRPCHAWDCEAMSTLAAIMAKLLPDPTRNEKTESIEKLD
jgi:hypothetical protein